ncbi:ATP-binding cassette sub-family A member 13 isoform X3 [Ailuropoda melanoleuca]|uniref:ATP-binding cassette sub-family A member 13 isoform X3 n=1 Tax=Ailuropoda melanoleuca TaxID=9646 RepID=UPI0014945FBA|nr:ATP-binding cassette sub-family A member 13 isoform X3 [Ailuropoda melanoleuca]
MRARPSPGSADISPGFSGFLTESRRKGMGPAGRQFGALLWKNWLCRLRHPVLSLAEFFWPCILFMILTVLRFQEPPRHRDNCFLQARDLPSRGVFPFVQALLCNTGSACRNMSYAELLERHLRSSRFRAAAGRHEVKDLAFLEEIQDLAEELWEILDKAKILQELWARRAKAPDSSPSSSFLAMDLNKTEEVISKLEKLHQQPHIWNFLLLLPRLYANDVRVEDRIRGGTQLLQAALNSLATLEELDWLPLNHTFSTVSEIVLNVTISMLTFLQEHGVGAAESRYNLSLQELVWDPQKVQADLRSRFGFDELRAERILNYSAELQEIPTERALERMVCCVLSQTSKDEADQEGHPGDCHPRWSAAADYLVHAVSWLQVYKQVFHQRQKGRELQQVLEGAARSLEELGHPFAEDQEPRQVVEALPAVLRILSDSVAPDGPTGSHPSPKTLLHLQKLENVLRDLPPWPALKRLLLLLAALRNAIAQNLHFIQEVIMCLEKSAHSSELGGPDAPQPEEDAFFQWKQLLAKNATDRCRNASLSGREAFLCHGNPGIWEGLWGLTCPHDSSNKTGILNKLQRSAEDADRLLQEVITGHTDGPVSGLEGFLGWQEVEAQLADVGLSCRRLSEWLRAATSPGDLDLAGDCTDPLIAALVFHTLGEVQLSLEETSYWKDFTGFIRKTCELVHYANVQGSVQNGQSASSKESPCYEENMDWEVITDNYFTFLSNLLKSPAASISRVLNSTKELLMMEKKMQSLEDEEIDFFLSFVEFLEKLLPDPFDSPSVPKFHDLPSLTETLLNTSHLWANHLRSLGSDPSATDIQKLLEFGKAVINKIETLERLWIKNESNNILRFMELVLSEIDPKLLELWMYGISKRERVNLETLSTLLNFSVPEDERDLSKNLNFSQLFHSDWPWSLAMETDFVHLSETVISSLYEFGFLKEGQVSAALDTVYAIRNASELFSALSEPERREVDRILTQIYLNVFQDNDSALLLKIYSSCFQYIYKFLSIPSTESLLSFLAQTSEHILDIIKQFNFQNIGKAFAFLYETIGALEGLSEGSYCQQLLSTFKYLELQAQSLMSTEGPELEVVHATLTGLKQLLMVDEDFRISVFQYMSQLFNGSVGALSDNECFALDNKSISSVNYSIHRGSPFILPWAQILSNLSANSSAFNELMAVHCTIVWLHMWTEIWGSVSQIFQFDMNIFTPLHVGLTQLLGELESDVKISKSCQGMFPTHRPARLLLNLFKNVTQADGFHDWDDFLALRDLWVVLGDALVRVKSLSPDQVGKSIFTMETALRQLKTFLFNTNASREFFYSLLDVFTELSDTSAYIDRNVGLINHFLSNNVTDYGVKFESVITKLRETMLLLQNVSHDQDVLSCADIFENVTEFILEDDSLHVNISQRTLRILAVLNSTFSSEDTISRLKGCVAWVDIMNRLYMIYNSSVIHGYPQGNWRSFRAVEDKINSTLKLVTWILNIKGPHCTLNKSDINCVHIVLKNVTDFLNALLTEVFEKERVPKFEILLTLLNDSTNQVRMIINNLTRDFDLASQSNWTRFTELILRPVALSGDVPRHFTEFWQHLVALGKEIQKLMKGTPIHILENNSSSTPDKCLNLCATSPKGTDVNRLGGSLYHLASYLVSNFSQDLQNPPQIIPHRITNAVGLGIQLMRDVFNSLAPSVLHSIPQDPGETQVFRKVASLLRTLKKTDIDLLVDQLEQMSESLTEFFKNISSLGTGSLGTNLLVGLMEKFVDSSHSWNVNHLLKFSHLFPKDDVNVVVDMYYVIPHAVRLLQRGVDKNITEVLKDVYNFTVLHGISISNVTKEDFAVVIKTLLDAVELISEKPEILSEAFTCLPVVWCWNHTTSGFRQNPKLEACKSHELMSSSFYSEVASLLDHLHLSPPGEGLQCMDEGSQKEITRKMVCVIRDLVDWTSLLLELSEVFHVKISLVKTVQEFWHKVLPFVPSSENQSNGSISELCPSGPIKQIASQIIAKLKNVNFTKIPLDENILDTLASLNKILNISEGTEASIQNKISLNFEKIMKFPSGDRHPENSTRSLDPPFVTFLDPNLTGSSLEAPSSFTEKRAVTYNSSYFEELGLELEQIMTDPSHDFPIRPLLSEIIKGIHTINSETLQNVTLQLAHFFKSLGSSSWKTAEIIEDFLLVVKNWLRKQAKEDDSRMIQTLFLLTANESLTDLALLTKDIATFLGLLKTTSREGNFDITHLTQLLSQEQLTNFSFVRFLFESFLVNLISKLAGSSPEAASNASNTDLHIMNLLTVNQTQSENGESIILPPRSIVDFTQQVLETFFSFLLEENSENRISLLLKAFHKDITAELRMIGVKPSISQDSDVVNMSSSTFSYVNQSKDFSDILKEIAEFLTSVKGSLGTMEQLVVAFNNGTQVFAMDSVNVWEEILDCLVPINNIINQIDFLHPNLLPTHSYPQDIIWKRTQGVIPFWDEMLSQDRMETGTSLRRLIDLTLEALWNDLEKDDWNVFNLLLTLAQHPDNLLKATETAGEVSGGRGDLSGALFSNTSLIQNVTHQQLGEAVQIMLRRIALLRKELPLNNSQWGNSTRTLFHPIFESFINAATGKTVTLGKEERTKKVMADFPYILEPLSSFEQFLKGFTALTEHWQEVPLMDQSVEMCQIFQQFHKPPEAIVTLQKVVVLVLRVFVILAENPSLMKDMLCSALSCKQGGMRRLLLPALQGAAVMHDHYQEIQKMWSSPLQLNCEGLSRNLSGSLESFKSSLEHATERDCECQPLSDLARQRVHTLAQSLQKTWLSGSPVLTFLSNFTGTQDVKVKDLMQNVSKLTHELRSSINISDETIHSILEASISRSQLLSNALTVALSRRCDADVLRLLLALPEDRKSRLAAKELCGLPGPQVYSLIVSMTQNMNLRNVIYKALMPLEAHGALSSLLDVVSRLSHLLAKAGHVLEYLPEFLHAYKITALLDMPDFQQAPHHGQTRSSAFGSFQFVMKKFCKEQASFFSGSNLFINLPRINELLGEDKEKFNIPEDSTPFCLNLYQEILQSPDGALVWSFLKPILHGKILYTPNTAEIHEVIQKANYTFHFMDKLKTLTETLLKMSSVFQSGGSGQMLSQLQEALRNKFIRNFIESQLHIDVDKLTKKLHTYGGKLDKMFAHGGAGRIHFLGRVLVNLSSCVVLDRFQALESVASLEAKARELMRQNSFLASIIFNTSLAGRNLGARSLQLPPHVTYTIRTSVLYSMRTDLVKNPFWKFHPQSLPADGFKYNYIFVPLQDMIERAIISVQTGKEAVEPAAQTQAIPYPCHTRDLFLNNVGFFFPLIMMLMWMVSVASMVRKLVYEREIQIEEYMRTMGVHPTVFFLAWFLENMAMLALSSAALAVILKASGIFAHSNACLIFLFLLDFAVSVVMLSYFLSAFFSRANTAALCTSLVYMISFLPYIVLLVLHNQLSVVVQTFLCLLSTTAFGQGVFFVTFLEGQEAGVQWSNVYQPPEQTGMTFGWVCWMILFDSGLYFLCGWYLNNLIPGTFGLRKPWYFPFTASYWKNLCGLVAKRPHAPGSDLSFINEHFDSKGSSLQNGEGKPGGGPPGVALISVTKEYEPHKAAVRDLTLTFHRDQITALLGTNGAGKTTVISMLTGLYAPTSGTIFINGKNLQTDLSSIRRELGVCLQQDVLFDNLTVREHLLLFASVKAPQWAWKELHQQVSRTLREVELTQHQHKQTRVLSGGMKRKLSIGIAFIGTSRTVVLDEPTSGVDPCSRRGIWDILLKYREGRTVIFTTHHLDEAEALSDRVAFLQQGRLRCCAPPFCLTEAYGQGLSLTLTKQTPVLEADDPKDIARATSLIQTYIPQAFLKASSGRELVYSIPKDADRACFKGLFQALEQNLHSLHVMGFGISDTTLEEVFLMLLQDSKKQSGAELEPQDQRPPEHVPGRCGALAGTPHAWGSPRPLAQAVALLGKRLRHTRRAWKGALSDLLLPVLFVALAMALFMVRPLAIDFLPLKLTPGHYDRAEAYFFSSGSGSEGQELAHVLLRKFGDQDPLCADLNPDPKNSSCWRVDPLSQLPAQDSCSCLRCPNVSAGAPYLTNRLGHTLLNLSAFHLEEYLLLPSERPRLGGWSFGVQIPDQVQDANPNTSQPDTLAKVWYNQKGFHSLPSYLNHLNNLILWRHLPPDQDWRQYGITLYSHPYGGALMNEDKILESIRQCGVALCIVLGFSILSASLGSSVVRDRVTGAKRLQHISGLGYRTYWLTNFLYDMVFYLVSVSLCVTIIVAFQLTAFTFRENLAATALLLALFGYATLPWMYLMSRIFSSSDVAFISYVSLNFIFGLCTMLMTTMPRLLAIVSKAQNLQNTYDVLKWVFTIFPQFCLGQGLIELCYNQIKYDLTHNFGIDSYVSPFEMNFLGWIFVQLASQGTVLLLLRILLHWDLLQRPRGQSAIQGTVTSSKDIDVEKEQIRVLKGRTSEDLLVLYNLSKTYGSFFKRTIAVRDISLGIRRGECFGLLGPNGAGKSTTFKMLNGDAPPTSGRAVVRTPTGEVVDLSLAGMAGVRIGYCPQQDALDELLTGWEHLHYYCCLRGIPKTSIPQVVGDLVRRLHLEAHVDKLVATYSGGTKRKLSTALALLGKPDLLLLDEPSSGMDPCSKRFLWNTIMQEARRGCAVVLTSHSMEECEALCTRLAIMVNGSFRCLGSPQHIKDRFGDGYSVKIWLCQETNLHGAVSDCLKLHFPGIQFKGQHLNLLEYHVPKQWECLADLFRVLENDKSSLNIKHYSITQTTLEQVFINFTTEPQKSSQSTVAAPRGSYQPPHLPI